MEVENQSQWATAVSTVNTLEMLKGLSWFFFSAFQGSISVLAFLRAQLRKAEHFRLMKMLVIGPPRQGKTALLEVLQTGKAAPFTPAECSISTSTWELDNPSGGRNVSKAQIWELKSKLYKRLESEPQEAQKKDRLFVCLAVGGVDMIE